jgi:serine/threonine-protein kinase HipA
MLQASRHEDHAYTEIADAIVATCAEVVEAAGHFRLTRLAALEILAAVHRAVRGWKGLARSAAVGMTERDLRDVEPAFEHEQVGLVERLLAG